MNSSRRRYYNVATNTNKFVIVLHLNQLNNIYTNGERIAPHCLDRIVVTHLAGLVIIFQLQYYYNIVLMHTLHNLHVYINQETDRPEERLYCMVLYNCSVQKYCTIVRVM